MALCVYDATAGAAAAATGIANNPTERYSDAGRPPDQSLVVWARAGRTKDYERRSIQPESPDRRLEDNTDRLCR